MANYPNKAFFSYLFLVMFLKAVLGFDPTGFRTTVALSSSARRVRDGP